MEQLDLFNQPSLDEQEVWKDIVGYEGLYQISNLGRVESLDRIVTRKANGDMFVKGRIMIQDIGKAGYPLVFLSKDNKVKTMSVHRLIAIHFIPNPDNKPCINHIDADKANNSIENLEWCTVKENNQHAFKLNIVPRPSGKNHRYSKAVIQYDLSGNKIAEHESILQAAKKLKTHDSIIVRCCKGKLKTAKGFIWRYAI